ncbi:MAG: PQQ-binding-like beta-propeller repeat protein, partial [Phycisphaerae bacterium]|nr:PQQ-binding-like beta-propeller repeat protein [Phycisphaerae bacterium]
RSFPLIAGDTTFIAGPTQIVAIGANRKVLWRGPAGAAAPIGHGVSDPNGSTRGPAYTSAAYVTDGKSPQIIAVRQPEVHADGWAIRALRGSDGKLLWTTEGNDSFADVIFASTPAIAGRYVYAIAGQAGDQVDQLFLIAIELTTGRQLWRADLGTVSHPPPDPHRNAPAIGTYRPWLNQTSPLITGDAVIAAPNIGVVVSVDRFDGSIRWLHPYESLGMPPLDIHTSALAAAMDVQTARHHRKPGDPPLGPPMRWNNTPLAFGSSIFVAPQDSASVMALDAARGKMLWEVNQFPVPDARKLDEPMRSLGDFSLIGVVGDAVALQGPSTIGLAMSDGHLIGRNDALINASGPAVVEDGKILVVTKDRGVLAATDFSDATPVSIPPFNTALKNDAIRRALQASDVLDCFTVPR